MLHVGTLGRLTLVERALERLAGTDSEASWDCRLVMETSLAETWAMKDREGL